MKLHTSYYSSPKLKYGKYIPIGISRTTPYECNRIISLAPSSSILFEYKDSYTESIFIERYKNEILSMNNVQDIIGICRRISVQNNRIPVVLLCYEKSSTFCHRHLVAEWLRIAGYSIEEL